jgi:hypothetical protein
MGGFWFSGHPPSPSLSLLLLLCPSRSAATFVDPLSIWTYIAAVLGGPSCASVKSCDNNVRPCIGIPVEP